MAAVSGRGPLVVLQGSRQLIRNLRTLGPKAETRVVRAAVTFSLTPMLKTARRTAPINTGALKLSMIKIRRHYKRKGIVYGGVGASADVSVRWVRGREEIPAQYAHIVEGGSKKHRIPREGRVGTKLMVMGESGDIVRGPIVHPGTKGTRFLSNAFQATKDDMLKRLRIKIDRGIAKEVRRMRK